MNAKLDMGRGETGFDRLLAFSLPDRDARGRIVRLGPVLETILAAHDYPPAIRNLLAEALVICSLMGSLVKDGGQLTMQAQASGGFASLLVCDYRDGELRGYVQYDGGISDIPGANPNLSTMFGTDSYLAITFDLAASGSRYQGIVPLDGATLSEACELYFRQSEQIPTMLRVAIQSDGPHVLAGGILIQHLPDGEEGRERIHVRHDHPDWEHVAILGHSVRHAELVDANLSLEGIVWRLFHEEDLLRVEQLETVVRGCRCTEEHYRDVLSRFGSEEREEMQQDDGLVHVDCAFCSRKFKIAV